MILEIFWKKNHILFNLKNKEQNYILHMLNNIQSYQSWIISVLQLMHDKKKETTLGECMKMGYSFGTNVALKFQNF